MGRDNCHWNGDAIAGPGTNVKEEAGRASQVRPSARTQKAGAPVYVESGDAIKAFGVRIEAHAPWTCNLDGKGTFDVRGPAPRTVRRV
ncbi:MAG: hypothetical protein ABSE73_23295 [Planctomycetota bacterium]